MKKVLLFLSVAMLLSVFIQPVSACDNEWNIVSGYSDNICPQCGGTGVFVRYDINAWGTFSVYKCMLCGVYFKVRS